jgi:hypothetical protein
VLRAERVDEGHRDAALAQVGGERHPVVARGLHGHQVDRLALTIEPGVEAVVAGPVLVHVQNLPVGLRVSLPAAGHRMLSAPDVDADGDHRSPPSLDHQGCPTIPVDVS